MLWSHYTRSCGCREIPRGGSGQRARIYAATKVGKDSKQFVGPKAGINRHLRDDVRQFVDGVSGGIEGIEKTSVEARSVQEEILIGVTTPVAEVLV